MNEIKNKPPNARIMRSGAADGGPSGVPNNEQAHLTGCLASLSRRENRLDAAKRGYMWVNEANETEDFFGRSGSGCRRSRRFRFFNWAGGNRRNNGRAYPE